MTEEASTKKRPRDDDDEEDAVEVVAPTECCGDANCSQKMIQLLDALQEAKRFHAAYVEENVVNNSAKRQQSMEELVEQAARGVTNALKREQRKDFYGGMDGEAMSTYSDAAFVKELMAHNTGFDDTAVGVDEDSASLLVSFLDAVISRVVQTAKREHGSNVGGAFAGQNDEEKYETRNDLLALILASVMSAGDPKFSWPKAMGFSTILKSLTNSKMVLDMVHAIIPSSPSYASVYSSIRKAVMNADASRGKVQFFRRDVIAMFDNLGEYRVKTRSAGQLESLKRVIPIITMMEFFYLSGDDFLQGSLEYAPAQFDSFDQLKEKHPNFWKLQETPMRAEEKVQIKTTDNEMRSPLHGLKDLNDDDLVSELEIFNTVLEVTLESFLEQYCSALEADGQDTIRKEVDSENNDKVSLAKTKLSELEQKYNELQCTFCGIKYGALCKICTKGCKRLLVKPLTEEKNIATVFRTQGTRKQVPEDTFVSVTSISANFETTMTRLNMKVDRCEDGTSTTTLGECSSSSTSASSSAQQVDGIRREVVAPVMVNPNTKAAFITIVNHLGRERGIPGPWMEESGTINEPDYLPKIEVNGDDMSQWMYVGFDQGADPTEALEDMGNEYKDRFHPILEAGHVYFNMLRMVLEILWNCGASEYAADFGFIQETAQNYLESGGDIHKTIQFVLWMLWPGLNNGAIRQYHIDSGMNKDDLLKAGSKGYLAWLRTDSNDATFRSNAFILTDILPALYCVVTGQRINDMSMYLAGCKKLCRMCFVLGKYNYGPAMLSEWAILWRCHGLVLRQRFESFSPLGEPFGLKLESTNKRVKRARTSTSRDAWLFAIMMEEAAKSFRSNILAEIGVKERDHEDRTPTDLSPDIQAIATKQHINKTWVKVPDRTEVFTFGMVNKIRSDCGVNVLYALGEERMEVYVPQFLNRLKSLTFPSKVYMTDALKEKSDKVKAKAAATRAVTMATRAALQKSLEDLADSGTDQSVLEDVARGMMSHLEESEELVDEGIQENNAEFYMN